MAKKANPRKAKGRGTRSSKTPSTSWMPRFAASVEKTLPHTDLSPKSMLHASHINLEAFPVLQLNALYSDLWVAKFQEAMKKAKKLKVPNAELAATLSPTAIRKSMFYLMTDLETAKAPRKQKLELADFMRDLLWISTTDDEFSLESNINLGELDVVELVKMVKWNKAGGEEERMHFGNLYLGAKALSEALYSYYYSEVSFENYGPYDVSGYFGDNRVLVVTDFRDLKPSDLWYHAKNYPVQNLRLFGIYKDTNIKLNAFNQMWVDSSLSRNLTHFAVVADSKQVSTAPEMERLSLQLGDIASAQYLHFSDLFLEELKKKMLEIRCYEFKGFFSKLGMDWRPSNPMLSRVKHKQFFELPISETEFSRKLVSHLK